MDTARDVYTVRRAADRMASMLGGRGQLVGAGYPDDAQATGHSPLIALTGATSPTKRQRQRAVRELGEPRASRTDIEVAITKATNRLPTPDQIRVVTRTLRPMPPH